MMSEPFFSIIIPTHNGADRIGKAIDSCIQQDFGDFELIIILDDCTDNTKSVVQSYATQDQRITMLEVNYHRDGLTRNAGLDIATGQYILFLVEDDWWLHEFVLKQMHDMLYQCESDVLEYAIIWRYVGYTYSAPGRLLPMVAGHCWNRKFIGNTRFDDARYSSDTHFLYELRMKHPVGITTALPMYYYNYMRPGSLSDRHERGEIN